MRKLSEIQNEEALDLIAEILVPVMEIASDAKVREAAQEGKMAGIQYVLKNHKSALMSILATIDGVPGEEYKVNVVQIPLKVMELLNDEDLMNFFQSQGLMTSEMPFGSAMESTEADEQ